jgi:hypothetical protein
MKLFREGGKLTGSYFYQKIGKRISLKGSVDENNQLTLEEYDSEGKQTGVFKGRWEIGREDAMLGIAGKWSLPDGKKETPFSLHEEPIYFSGAVEIIAKTTKETSKPLKYDLDVEYPEVTGLLSPGWEKFNQEASKLLRKEINEFKKNMAEEPPDTSEETNSGSSLDIGYTIALATDDLISVQFDVGTYYRGAAHPNSNAIVLNFDVQKSRTLRLADLFKPGAKFLNALSSYSISNLKKQSAAIGADSPLDDTSIESGASPTAKNFANWTITKKGLGIHFDAYQVAPYAAGPQYVLVPYSALQQIIDENGVLGSYLQ